jgi:hypothetical protein
MAAAPVTTVVVDAGAMTAASTADAATPPPAPVGSASGQGNASTGADAGPDFYSCATDSDCTAVAKVGCCQNGFLEAVNKQSAEAYRASFVCDKKRPICPMYRILDKRVPLCESSTHRCELVQPEQIGCGGTGPNVHACAAGYKCDAAGHCVATP